jgi:hypothetical protein
MGKSCLTYVNYAIRYLRMQKEYVLILMLRVTKDDIEFANADAMGIVLQPRSAKV